MSSIFKSWLARQKLHRKLMMINLLAITMASIPVAVLISVWVWQDAEGKKEHAALIQAQVVAENSVAGLLFEDRDAVADTLSVLKWDQNIESATVFDKNRNVFVRIGKPIEQDIPAQELIPENGIALFHQAKLDVWMPIKANSEQVGVLRVRENLMPLYSRVLMLCGMIFLGALLAFVLSAWLAHRMLNRVTQPFIRLADLMRRMSSEGDYSSRSDIATQDEIGDLASSFNLMIDRIERDNLALSRELEQRREAESKLDRLAHFDGVAQTTNRHYFERRLNLLLDEIKKRGKFAALIFNDMDDFKHINDTHGHHVGDILLRTLAERLSLALGAGGEISRLGGDEFAVILPDIHSPEQVGEVAAIMRRATKKSFQIEDHTLFIGISMGIVLLPVDTSDYHTALRYADMAMYHAKRSGKNNYQFYRRALSDEQNERFLLGSSLRTALKQQQFELYYQPIYRMGGAREVLGAEALIRWNHPQRGLVSPDEFIPLAEETGLIVPMGIWVMETACREAVKWQSTGKLLFVSVNLSPRQLGDSEVTEHIKHALDHCGLAPELLELELTETVLADKSAKAVEILVKIHQLGVRLVLDDFGTGYSSLSYLKHFPIAKLKIDRSFVNDLPHDPGDKAICNAVIALGHGLQVTVLAEGVETIEQADILREMNCQQVQGYLYSHPLPAKAFEDILRGGAAN